MVTYDVKTNIPQVHPFVMHKHDTVSFWHTACTSLTKYILYKKLHGTYTEHNQKLFMVESVNVHGKISKKNEINKIVHCYHLHVYMHYLLLCFSMYFIMFIFFSY